jgi:hypothetical protein
MESWFDSRQEKEIFLLNIIQAPALRRNDSPVKMVLGAVSARTKRSASCLVPIFGMLGLCLHVRELN